MPDVVALDYMVKEQKIFKVYTINLYKTCDPIFHR